MSEPMTAVEIEDVLSSIRRLVSEDLRPTHRLVSAALEKGASKLILTPALRIVSDDRGALPERADGSDDPQDLRSVLQGIETGEPAEMAQLAESSEGAETAEILPVFGSVRQHDQTERSPQDMQDTADGAPSDADFLTTAMSRINVLASANDNVDEAGHADRIETVVAVVGAAVGPEEWEPDGGEPAPQAEAWADSVWNSAEPVDDVVQQDWDATLVLEAAAVADLADSAEASVEVRDVVADATYDPPADPSQADDVQAEDMQVVAADENADVAVETSAVSEAGSYVEQAGDVHIDDVYIDDVQAGDVQAGDVQAGDVQADDLLAEAVVAEASEEDAVEFGGQDTIVFQDAAAVPDQNRGFDAAESRATAADLDDTAGFVSEDLLREIVRDMIRDELQGNLGERITRNVRKLVRAEINRALESRDFE
jgi:hypothetical protein